MADQTRFYGTGAPVRAPNDHVGLAQPEIAATVLLPTAQVTGPAVAEPAPPVIQPLQVELAPGTQIGEYRIVRKLGEGGMGAVYAGEQPTIGKRVAVKVLAPHCAASPELVRRFLEEARAANQIRHPHIIDIFSFGQLPDGRHYFLMEYLDGESLADAIANDRLAAAEMPRILGQICSALAATHKVGIVHRDLKPENIWIARPPHGDSYVKLLDFGIAKLLDPTRTNLTHSGVVMGTPLFMSPEQCMGRDVDALTDIYALGVLLYRIFTGRYPFEGSVITELVFKHVTETPPPPSALRPMPAELEALILRCLAKDASARPKSAGELGERLVAILGSWSDLAAVVPVGLAAVAKRTPTAVIPNSPTPAQTMPLPEKRGSRKPLWIVGAVAVAALVGAGLWLLQRLPVQPTYVAPVAPVAPAAPVINPAPTPAPAASVVEPKPAHPAKLRHVSAAAAHEPAAAEPAKPKIEEAKPAPKSVLDETPKPAPAPKPTRAQEHGLIDDNPLRH